MNIYDISEKAGVSIATVSRVLNGNSKVSEKTRQKVLAIMEETGYQPNVFARGLGLNTMYTVGILCADSSDLVLASAVYYMEQELRRYHYDALLCCTGYDLAAREKYLKLLLSKRVDALILAGSSYVEADREMNRYIIEAAKEVPVIILNGYLEAPNIYCACCEDQEVMQRLTGRFLKETDRILYVYRSLSYAGRAKLEGVKQAFAQAGKTLQPEQQLLLNGSIEEVRNDLLERYGTKRCWDVIMTSDDELAAGACKYARAAGFLVPGDLQITGYNNSRISICCEPEITSVDNRLEHLSRNCVSMLIQVLSGEEVPSYLTIPGKIIARGTTKAL